MATMPHELRQRLRTMDRSTCSTVVGPSHDAERSPDLLRELEAHRSRGAASLCTQARSRRTPCPSAIASAVAAAGHRRAECDVFEAIGEAAFARRDGRVSVVAGGQGTRLGFDHPKGMFPIGPISQEDRCFRFMPRRCWPCTAPWRARSVAGDDQPRHRCRDAAVLQRTQLLRPAAAGRVVLLPGDDARRSIWRPASCCWKRRAGCALARTATAARSPALPTAACSIGSSERGIRTIFYFQVDNPLVKLADSLFLGRHLDADAEVSSKVLPKTGPKEKLGNFVLVDGRCSMIEYSDLPDDWAQETDDDGAAQFWAGNPAIHLFDVDFLREVTAEARSAAVARRPQEGAVPRRDGQAGQPTTRTR